LEVSLRILQKKHAKARCKNPWSGSLLGKTTNESPGFNLSLDLEPCDEPHVLFVVWGKNQGTKALPVTMTIRRHKTDADYVQIERAGHDAKVLGFAK